MLTPTRFVEEPLDQPLPTSLLGLPVSAPSGRILIRCLETPLKLEASRAYYLANVDFKSLLDARENEQLHRSLTTADHLFPTGFSARLGAQYFGLSNRQKQSHWSATKKLLDHIEATGKSVYLLGEKPAKGAVSHSRIKQRRPTLKLLGEKWIWSKDWAAKDAFELNRELRELRPDVLLVSLKHIPAKIWIAENGRSLANSLVLDLGASNALFSRLVSARAEHQGYSWLARGMERLKTIPMLNMAFIKRWGQFIFQLFEQRQIFRTCQKPTPPFPKERPFPIKQPNGYQLVSLPGRFDAVFLRRFRSEWLQLADSRTGVVLDATTIQSFDMNALGCLLQLTQTLDQRGLNLVIQNPPMSLVRCLQQSKIPKSLHTRYNQGAAEDLARSSVSHSLADNNPSGEAIVWKGNVTAQTVDRIWDETMDKIKQKEQKTQSFQIDLSHVTLLDSTGIGVMIKLKKRMVKQGYRLAFVNPRQNVQKILKMTQLSEYLLKN